MTDPLLDALAKPPPPPSELDELISRDPLELTAIDIDKIIAMQRQYRARKESGAKTRKAKDEGPPKKIDLAALGLVKAAPKPTLPAGPKVGSTSPVSFRRI